MNRRAFLGLTAAAAFARPPRGRLLAAATCDAEDRIAVADVHTGNVVRTIACLPDPRSIERVGRRDALVCHTNVGAVTILDGRRLAVRHVLHGFEEPRYAAAHPDGRHAFVTDSGRPRLVALDIATGIIRGSLRLPDWPRHLSLAPDGRTLFVGLGNASATFAVVDVADPARPRHDATIRAPFPMHDVGAAPEAARVWVTSGSDGSLALYDHRLGVVSRLAADAAPQHVTFVGSVAYVTSGAAGTLRALSAADGRVLATTRVAVGSYNVQAGHGLVLTPSLDRGTLTILDRRARVLHEVVVAGSSHDACFLG